MERFDVELSEYDLAMLMSVLDRDSSGGVTLREMQKTLVQWRQSKTEEALSPSLITRA